MNKRYAQNAPRHLVNALSLTKSGMPQSHLESLFKSGLLDPNPLECLFQWSGKGPKKFRLSMWVSGLAGAAHPGSTR